MESLSLVIIVGIICYTIYSVNAFIYKNKNQELLKVLDYIKNTGDRVSAEIADEAVTNYFKATDKEK